MRPPTYWWFARFAQFAIVLSLALMLGMALIAGLWAPTSHWLFHGGWQWMPFDRWIRYVLVCIPIALLMALVFTAYEWWQSRK